MRSCCARPPTQLANVPKLQVFASDIDEAALEIARAGRYPATIEKDLSSERLAAYFVREDGTCRVTADLREMCLFATHNLLRDAPFSKVDLISCRNLLIYLDADIQNRVIPLFHYALTDKGFLLLGPSENVSRHARMFTTVDKQQRIFRKRALPERNLPEFPLSATDSSRRRQQPPARPGSGAELTVAAERLILDRFGPPYVIVTADGDLLHTSARTGKYLELAPGVPSTNIVSMARRGLRLDLRTALHRAVKGGQAATRTGLTVRTNGGQQTIDLTIQPLPDHHGEDRTYLVVFQDVGAIRHDEDRRGGPRPRRERACQPPGGRTARGARALADGDGGARILQRGAEIGQRGTLLDERGTTVGQRGAGDFA